VRACSAGSTRTRTSRRASRSTTTATPNGWSPRIVRDLDIDPKRFPPKQLASAIGHAKDRVLDPTSSPGLASNFYEEIVAKV
jgi:hypothetical protein